MQDLAVQEYLDKGEEYLVAEAYGAAAHYFYRAILTDKRNVEAWVGLSVSAGIMHSFEVQTVLARYVRERLPFQKEMIVEALLRFRDNPRALAEWKRLKAQEWIETPQLAVMGVRTLRYFPHPRSEKILRRLCRNEEVEPKLKTHALLSLRSMGIQGNVRVEKFDASFIVNLDKPFPVLQSDIPAVFTKVIDWIALWLAKEERLIDQNRFEQLAMELQEPSAELPEDIVSHIANGEIPVAGV